jgi:hypothetical protein
MLKALMIMRVSRVFDGLFRERNKGHIWLKIYVWPPPFPFAVFLRGWENLPPVRGTRRVKDIFMLNGSSPTSPGLYLTLYPRETMRAMLLSQRKYESGIPSNAVSMTWQTVDLSVQN